MLYNKNLVFIIRLYKVLRKVLRFLKECWKNKKYYYISDFFNMYKTYIEIRNK
jgi:hypothetical protein